MDDQMAKMAERGIPSIKLTDHNYRAVIDKFILSNYDNSICDLNILYNILNTDFSYVVASFSGKRPGFFVNITAVLHVC
jgi:hypothetical protein